MLPQSLHKKCPLQPDFVRGVMYAKYHIISRQTEIMDGFLCNDFGGNLECIVKQTVKVFPFGWVPTKRFIIDGNSYSFADTFGLSMLRQIINMSINSNEEPEMDDRYLFPDSFSTHYLDKFKHIPQSKSENNSINKVPNRHFPDPENYTSDDEYSFVDVVPPLKRTMWSATQARLWKVRGKNYMKDRKKVRCDDSLFKLLAVDIVESSKPIMSGLCAHPTERMQRALKLEKTNKNGSKILPSFVIAINIFVPGPPYFHFVSYYGVPSHMMDELRGKTATPFSKLSKEFFFGEDDSFRDKVFKLFPRLHEGNFIVRSAVGSTPALIGKRLKQYYYRTDRYFELVIDTSSKSRAAKIISLSKGFAKSLVVDLAFGLEGNSEDELPEKIMGCCRLNYLSFSKLRKVVHPDDL